MKIRWETVVGLLGLLVFIGGQFYGLTGSVPSSSQGETSRILYIHVPSAWTGMALYTVAFIGAVGFLFTGRKGFDWVGEAGAEVGNVLSVLVLAQGSIWAHRTFGVWWDWDPRLTSSAVMLLAFVGVALLRSLVVDAGRRAVWSSVATIVAYVNVPIVYISVRLGPSLHQSQSGIADVDGPVRIGWLINVAAFALLGTWMVTRRWRLAAARDAAETPPPLPEAAS